MRKIAIYGKGGIGKSTTCSNLCAALSIKNNRILQVGCDPKHDSCRTLTGKLIPTVLDTWREAELLGKPINKNDILFHGFNNISCIEAGGPVPGEGCAGRGVIKMMEILNDLGINDIHYDYVFYDVLGDVVCGGFAKPIQEGFANEIYIVTSGEFMSLYAANNISKAISTIGTHNSVGLGGVILNSRNIPNEENIVREFCSSINANFIMTIPRDNNIAKYEKIGQTVIEGNSDLKIAQKYLKLADKIEKNTKITIPNPMEEKHLRELYENSFN